MNPAATGSLPAPAPLDQRQAALLRRYVDLLLARNAAFNLTAARDAAAAEGHVRDSLTLVPYIAEPFVDVGSGGGFPAIPLAIATGFRGTLVESVAKKARFLRETIEALGLPLDVRDQRAEEAARDPGLRERFVAATGRAVGSIPTVLELTLPFLRAGGVAVLQRGAVGPAERDAASDAALMLGGRIEADLRAYEPGDERRVLLVRKVSPSAVRFPRRAGVPAKRPLCLDPGRHG